MRQSPKYQRSLKRFNPYPGQCCGLGRCFKLALHLPSGMTAIKRVVSRIPSEAGITVEIGVHTGSASVELSSVTLAVRVSNRTAFRVTVIHRSNANRPRERSAMGNVKGSPTGASIPADGGPRL